MSETTRRKGRKNRKHGRNKVACARYRAEGRREINKARRARRHQKHYNKPPNTGLFLLLPCRAFNKFPSPIQFFLSAIASCKA